MKFFILIIFTVSLIILIEPALSQTVIDENLRYSIGAQDIAFRDKVGFTGTARIGSVVSILIQSFFSLLALIFIILIIIAGYDWMTAQGDETKVTKAKDTIQRAIIGLIIIIAAYAITYFVFNYLSLSGGGGFGTSP